MESLFAVGKFTPEVQAEAAKTVLALGKREYGGRMAFDFLDGLYRLAEAKNAQTNLEDVEELRGQVLNQWEIKAN